MGRQGSTLRRRSPIRRKAVRLNLDHLLARCHRRTATRLVLPLCRHLALYRLLARLVHIPQRRLLVTALQLRSHRVRRHPTARQSMDLRPFPRSPPLSRSRRLLLRPSLHLVRRSAQSTLLTAYPTLSPIPVQAPCPCPVVECDRLKARFLLRSRF